MHGLSFLSLSLILPALSTAHFQLLSPPARGFDEDKLATFPCGGQDTVSSNRTMFPLSGGPIQLNMEHDEAAVQVLLAMGNDPGSNFNITLLPIMQEQGIGKFCIAGDMVPMSAMAMDGMNATIQVVTNGDPNGGLYNCADITFSSSATAGECSNGTGVTAAAYKGTQTNANATSEESGSTQSASGTASTSSQSGAAVPGKSVEGLGGLAGVLMLVTVGWMAVGGMVML